MNNQNRLARQVMEALTAKFGNPNEKMFRKDGNLVSNFYDTSDARIKVAVQNTVSPQGDATSIMVCVAVEEPNRPGTFFALGDRLHLPLDKFPEYTFHQELNAKLSFSSSRSDLILSGKLGVLAFTKELTEKL